MGKNILVTGGAGFIGCNFVRRLLTNNAYVNIIIFDALTYAGNAINLEGLKDDFGSRYTFVQGDVCSELAVATVIAKHEIDTIVHFAAESHVDRSIGDPITFINTNVLGTANLLECARLAWRSRGDVRFHHISTDEVYGSLGSTGSFSEETPYDPSSPYSASKAASDHLVRAWHKTFGLPATISNCSNNYGPYQHPEKLIPNTILNAYNRKPIPVYGRGTNVRDWLHVDDHCAAIESILEKGIIGRTYNIGASNEVSNIDTVMRICDFVAIETGRSCASVREQIQFVQDRPGHDLRYAINSRRIRGELGWKPRWNFDVGLRETVRWYLKQS
jgi:dTDP-glucose 4,6-dehydratase